MKRTTLLALIMMLVMVLSAQETVTLRFTSTTPSGSYFPFDVVNVTNVTRGWTESLAYPDTTMVLTALTGLDENFDNGGFLSEVYPNPLSGTASVMFGMNQPGIISAKILSINGSVLSEYNDKLEEGSHYITINMSEPQMAFFVVKTNDKLYVKKILNISYGDGNSITINKVADGINKAKERTIGDFEIGDVMSYMAVSFVNGNMIESERIIKEQYGNDLITLIFNNTTNGILPGLFSVCNTQQVYFSQGNLQYQASTDTWKFADNQYDYIGNNNCYISPIYNGWIDMFGWGTGVNPTNTSTNPGDYSVAYDWGINSISNGGATQNMWRTLSSNEWDYVINQRNTLSGIRNVKATVNGICGLILLPDNWESNIYNFNNSGYSSNIISLSDWTNTIEANGAVFLPAGGYRNGFSITDAGSGGYYWTNTPDGDDRAYHIRHSDLHVVSWYRNYGYNVRLVYNAQTIEVPTVTTQTVTDITQTSAVCGGNVTSDGGGIVTTRGVCWSTSQNPTISNNHTTDGTGVGVFASDITGLNPNTTYYVKAYATNSAGTSYGEQMIFTTEPISLPTVITGDVISITSNTAVCGGNVTADGGGTITARGVCWSTAQNPTINDQYTIDGNGTGVFTSIIAGLNENTTYYVRAYATNQSGTSYGEQSAFTTLHNVILPTIITNAVSNVTTNSATCGGNVTFEGYGVVSARGVCWSTTHDPTINDAHTIDGSGMGDYSSNLNGLVVCTTYYVRAYATNQVGTAYGNEVSFTTEQPIPPTGAIVGLFSTSETQKVWFSKGNLQYKASTNTWRFADNQWDYVGSSVVQNGEPGGTVSGSSNHMASSTYNGWIDIFSWGTSGYNHGAINYRPWNYSGDANCYYAYGNWINDLNHGSGKADWGYNAISNGGNAEHIWRTLTKDEWVYIFMTRNTLSGIRYVKATVNGVKGVIIFPDNWNGSMYSLNSPNMNVSFSANIISQSNWISIFEANGAVFIPAGGYRSVASGQLTNIATYGGYWSSTHAGDSNAYCVKFTEDEFDGCFPPYRTYGATIRLVSNAE